MSVVSVRKDGDAVGLSSIDGSFSSLYIYSYARPSVRPSPRDHFFVTHHMPTRPNQRPEAGARPSRRRRGFKG